MKLQKPKVGLLGLMLELYDAFDPKLRESQGVFARQIVGELEKFSDVVFPGIVNTRGSVRETMSLFNEKSVDLIICIHFAYAPSLISLEALKTAGRPILIWNTQKINTIGAKFSAQDWLENHGMHGPQDMCNVLNRAGVPFTIVTGHFRDAEVLGEIRDWAEAARAVGSFSSSCVGLIGHPFPDMGDFGVDETELLDQVGMSVRRISLAQLSRTLDSLTGKQVAQIIKEDRQRYIFDRKLSAEEIENSARAGLALKRTVKDLRLSAVAVHYPVIADDPRFPALPFKGVSELLAEGIGFGGEGDITAAAACVMLKELAGEVNFSEMFTMDFKTNEILMSHYAEANWKMAHKGHPIRAYRREGWIGRGGISASLGFTLKPGRITLLNLTTAPGGKFKIIATEAEVTDHPPLKLDSPHFRIRPERKLAELLNAYACEGGSHHLAMAYGSQVSRLEKTARILGLIFVRI